MGADLFESFVGSIIAAATLANGDAIKVALPFWIAGAGIVASVIGFFAVGTKDGASQRQLLFALHKVCDIILTSCKNETLIALLAIFTIDRLNTISFRLHRNRVSSCPLYLFWDLAPSSSHSYLTMIVRKDGSYLPALLLDSLLES